ncbi:MAG: FAD-dependent oxidoreductase [Acidovorax sp.]|jgi:monoamine oxidase|nr:FAD-dependent oxidoreductase [Acidovorax sp.]
MGQGGALSWDVNPVLQRRQWLQAIGAGTLALAGCTPSAPKLQDLAGGYTGNAMERGHSLRPFWQRLAQGLDLPAPAVVERVPVVIAGGGMAGLAAARVLDQQGVAAVLLDTQDAMGGNSRGGSVAGVPCPLGAHYLPLPSNDAPEVQDWLQELGLRSRVAGRWQYDERHLCHSPQERHYRNGQWSEGLLPVDGVGSRTLQQYQQWEQLVRAASASARFSLPAARCWQGGALAASHAALDGQRFDRWLASQGIDDPHLLWYLDYCCRDDFGAGIARVSAWAGLHYFASRRGFHAPRRSGDAPQGEEGGDQVLTWAQGNGWLVQQLLQRLGHVQQRTGCSVLAITVQRHGVQVDAYDHAAQQHVRWLAARCVVALPSWIAARVLRNAPGFVQALAGRLDWAPWLVANLHLDRPLADYPGAEPAWDNVLYQDPNAGGLGYVDAGHQRLDRLRRQPTVLSYYQALGDWPDGRQQLQQAWTFWRDRIAASLGQPHADLLARVTRMEITRYGHAMAIPRPGDQQFLSQIALQSSGGEHRQLWNGERVQRLPLAQSERLVFAHSDWAGYSVLEEAFVRGHHAGLWALQSSHTSHT